MDCKICNSTSLDRREEVPHHMDIPKDDGLEREAFLVSKECSGTKDVKDLISDPVNKGCMKSCSGVSCHTWLLIVWVFVFNALMSIYYGSFGLLYIEYSNYFKATKAEIGWIIAIEQAIGKLASEL